MGSTGRSVHSYEKGFFFSVFRSLGPFPHVFGQKREKVTLELNEIIRILHVVVLPMDFNLLCDLGQ